MLSFISSLLYPLIFPKFNLHFLFPVAFTPLLLFSLNCRQKNKLFFYTWISGTIANMTLLYWLYVTMRLNEVNVLASALGLVLFSAYLGLYWAAFSIIVNIAGNIRTFSLIFFIPCAWVLLEYIRTYLFTGIPWLLAGYSLWNYPELIQIASYTGVYGLSFIVILANTCIALLILRKKKIIITTGILSFLILLAYGTFSISMQLQDPTIKISILQGNISQYKKFNSAYTNEILQIYTDLHQMTDEYDPALIVWPETSLPGMLTSDSRISDYITNLSVQSGSYELVGSIERTRSKYYNSSYMVSPDAIIDGPYRKIHILPFGEYFPMRSFLSLFTDVVGGLGDYNRGSEYFVFKTESFNAAVGICFESVFPQQIRKFFDNGADLFVNITNDGWFVDTAGAYQHFIHSIIRAVENRTYVIRSANTGISAVIAPTGHIISNTKLLEAGILNAKVATVTKKTFYSKYGDIFIILCLFFAAYITRKELICLKKEKTKLMN
ncbi:apolipoprotein N-acyltransferase [Elusimicrobiota bacterium]